MKPSPRRRWRIRCSSSPSPSAWGWCPRWRRWRPRRSARAIRGMVRRALRVGLWAALLISLPMMVLPLYGEQILLRWARRPSAAQLAQKYLLGLAWGLTPGLWFLAIRGFMGAVNRPEPGLWITLAAIPANARAGLSPDPRRMGTAAAGIVRRRPRHHDHQFRHVPGGAVVCAYAAGRSGNITCWAGSGASTGC